jgi:heat shock protein HslJ
MHTPTTPLRSHDMPSPTGTPRVIAAMVLAAALVVAGCGAASLAGPTWQWAPGLEAKASGGTAVGGSAAYTIEFHTNGTVKIKADCNTLTGTYSIGVPLDLAIDVTAASLADCGESSLDAVYLATLERITTYSTEGGELRLFLEEDVEAMRFTTG